MTADVLNPVDVETGIRELSTRIAKGVAVVSSAYAAYLLQDRAYDRAFALAYLNAEGPAHERKYVAEVDTNEEREVRDVADVAFRHADRLAKALELELRALQSIGASVRAMYGVAGRGEGA